MSHRDYGDECDRCDQLAFDVPHQPKCRACGALNPSECDYPNWDHDRVRRPRTCLNRYDPATAPWPPGFGEAA